MSSITATLDAQNRWVRLVFSFATEAAIGAYITRVNETTGETVQVRTHGTTLNPGDGLSYQSIPGWGGTVYDTEAPRGVPIHYVAATRLWQLLANPLTGSSLDPWTKGNNAYAVLGPIDRSSIGWYWAGNTLILGSFDGTTANPEVVSELVSVQPGQVLNASAQARTGSSGTTAEVGIRWYTSALGLISTSTGTAVLPSRASAGIPVTTGAQTAPATAAYARMYLRWQSTHALSIFSYWQNATLSTTANTGSVSSTFTIPSGTPNVWWLRDPLRPGNDVQISDCFPSVGNGGLECVPDQGVMFVGITGRQQPANASRFPVINQAQTVTVGRVRAALQGTLTLVTRTNADEAALTALLAPGTPLLFQSPPEYNLPDLYLSIDTAQLNPTSPDQRFPLRAYQLPFVAELAPGGPALGTIGTRWMDLCATTWAAANAGGKTWQNIMAGP